MLAKIMASCRAYETPDRAQISKHFRGIGGPHPGVNYPASILPRAEEVGNQPTRNSVIRRRRMNPGVNKNWYSYGTRCGML